MLSSVWILQNGTVHLGFLTATSLSKCQTTVVYDESWRALFRFGDIGCSFALIFIIFSGLRSCLISPLCFIFMGSEGNRCRACRSVAQLSNWVGTLHDLHDPPLCADDALSHAPLDIDTESPATSMALSPGRGKTKDLPSWEYWGFPNVDAHYKK